MGVEWGLQMVRPDTLEAIDDTVFDPHPIEEGELDLILVGDEEGPIFDLLCSGATGCDHDQPDFDWISHHCPPATIAPEAVRRCADRLSAITRERYLPPETFLAGRVTCHEEWYYEAVAGVADEFRRYIARAADHGYALRYSVSG